MVTLQTFGRSRQRAPQSSNLDAVVPSARAVERQAEEGSANAASHCGLMAALPGFEFHPFEDAGSYVAGFPAHLVIHSTEGSSIEGAESTYKAHRSAPHAAVDLLHRWRVQHISLDRAAPALETNRGRRDQTEPTACWPVFGPSASRRGWPAISSATASAWIKELIQEDTVCGCLRGHRLTSHTHP